MSIPERHFPIDQIDDQRLGHAVQVLTTEHFTLQTGRSSTVSEANGRITAFMASISGTLIAIGFIGQVSRLGDVFHAFTLLVLPCLLLVGVATFARLVQCAAEDIVYGMGINRIRHFYVEVVPELRDYFVESIHDDLAGVTRGMTIEPSRLHRFVTAAGLVAILDGVIAGAGSCLLARWLGGWPLEACAALGVAVGVAIVLLLLGYAERAIERLDRRVTPLFPSPGRRPSP